jgi:hypothetical protein
MAHDFHPKVVSLSRIPNRCAVSFGLGAINFLCFSNTNTSLSLATIISFFCRHGTKDIIL